MSTPPPDHADVIRNALRLAADNAYPDDLARPYQEALRALIEGQITVTDAPPVVTSEISYTGYGGEPLTVTDEAAEALKAGGFVIVSVEDVRIVSPAPGLVRSDQREAWERLAAAAGVSR